MKALIQRVIEAQVAVGPEIVGRIGPGLLVLLGVGKADTSKDSARLAERILSFRIFDDENGKMNRSLRDIEGQILIISQFTLVADVSKGRRPNFTSAAEPKQAKALFQEVVNLLIGSGLTVETGRFGARMIVSLHNDGPVTFLIES